MTQQFIEDTNKEMIKPSIMFDWSYLEYVTSAVKSSSPHNGDPHHLPSEFLSVNHTIDHSATPDRIAHSYVSAPLSHLRSILGLDFFLRSDQAAKFVLDQLHHLSFIEREDRSAHLFQDLALENDVQCVFPLPLGLDLSTNVETLDSNLAIILREFVAKQRNLPGVRSPQNMVPWPPYPNTRSSPSSTAGNGGDFVNARRSLLSRYALPWLSRLHALDPAFYCQTLFETCSQIAAAGDLKPTAMSGSAVRENNQPSRLCDNLLRSIIKLSQNSVTFSVFDATVP
ncbi:hypothetical protein M413DRAFT_21376 [Hebeloma cylindrosporum]|uniref:Uncharacterized protein n=1 Tax=Hebeloma cylindrosporum TaxID=76867 RepID=A0A0C3CY58_HEBCY|nr:hypothetical protein M413DRAFT_21376 [Hebeloma cylindrosporum h7]